MAGLLTWESMAKAVEEVYGVYVDWDEKFFICPECDEPIYAEDYNHFIVDMNGDYHCPVCEEVLDAN